MNNFLFVLLMLSFSKIKVSNIYRIYLLLDLEKKYHCNINYFLTNWSNFYLGVTIHNENDLKTTQSKKIYSMNGKVASLLSF